MAHSTRKPHRHAFSLFKREERKKKKTRGQEKAYLLNVREKKNKTNKGTKKRCIKKS